jgi:hypothetical protein
MDRRRLTLSLDFLWLAAAGLVSSLYCGASAERIGPSFDEPLYVRCGLERWRSGSTYELMRVGTMPLPVDIAALPVAVWERLRDEPFEPIGDLHCILPVARIGNLAFWWVLLVYAWLIARRLGGPWAGRLSAALLASEPNMLAHAGLATTDMALTATLVAFCFHYWLGRGKPWPIRVGIPTLWYAAAVLAKASALMFVPICMVAIEFHRLWSELNCDGPMPRLRDSIAGVFSRSNVRDAAATGLIGWSIVFVYCGSDFKPHAKLVASAHALPEGAGRDIAVWTAEHFRVFNNAGVAMSRQIQHNAQGHSTYLLGETAPRAIWYYFPAALSIKLTIPLMVLVLSLGLMRPQVLWNWPFLAAVALLAFSFTCRVQIGIRFFLPLIAFACVAASVAVVHAVSHASLGRRRFLFTVTGLLIAWSAIESAAVWPNGLCYTNELWGGTARGYERLSDSNYDWGQGLPELARWAHAHEVREVAIWYFGTDPAAQRPPFRVVHLHATNLDDMKQLRNAVGCRFLAVSTTLLYGSYVTQDHSPILAFLRNESPVGRTQTFVIYDLGASEPPAVAASQ